MKILAYASLGAPMAVMAGGAAAQDDATSEASQTRPVPCEGEPYRDFDFWIGEWNVTGPDGQIAGKNAITSEESGCLIVERWTGASGGTGQSYNFYDPGLAQWRQVWVAPGATIDYAGGLNGAGAMVLEGEISYRGGATFPFRGRWTPNEDGSVTQAFEQYNPETDVWDDWFTGTYRQIETSDEEASTE
ncbi:hypothetical protein [Henriciella litoralis]|uniref:hypothetical protein n=1 Tax=Henriciella litoralis TaxID=568102 RepID=UPI0009FF7E82|nr:hypothetical protein [Henriciella litoralis]